MINEKLQTDLLAGIEALTSALVEHKQAAVEHANADHKYRQAKATAYLMVVASGEKMTVDHIRSLRTEISAMQSIAGAYREETAALRYGQTIG